MKFEAVQNDKGLIGRVHVDVDDRIVAFPVWATASGFRFGRGEVFKARGGFVIRCPGDVSPESVPELLSDECLDLVIEGAGDVLQSRT